MGFARTRTSAGIACNDYRDIDRGELELILEGQRLWYAIKRGKTLGVRERTALYEELEAVWKAKREYRAELKVKRAEESAKFAARMRELHPHFRQTKDGTAAT